MVIGTKQISKREKNRIRRRSWVGYCFKEKNQEKKKNREELGGYGFHYMLHLIFFFYKYVTLKICQINGLYQ